MKYTLMSAIMSLALLVPAAAVAGPVENACNRSDRPGANRALCRCIDAVASQTLTRSEQRRAARFFANPDDAQSVRMSRTAADNEFWRRYRAFGEAAERNCVR